MPAKPSTPQKSSTKTVAHKSLSRTNTKNTNSKVTARPASKRTAPSQEKTVEKALDALTPKSEKAPKVKKIKLVRDSFTIPKDEFEVIHALKKRGEKLVRPIKKSELLRAGIKVLANLSDAAFKAAINQVPIIKTGRPKSAK